MNKVLEARENRALLIQKQDFLNNNIIVIKANIPGPNKNLKIAYLLINIFKNEITKIITIKEEFFFNSDDGPYYLLLINKVNIKGKLINLEESHPLGRFIDLDLFIDSRKSISRNEINRPLRKCMICDNDAIRCVREKKHGLDEIISLITENVFIYFADVLNDIISESIFLELNLDNKFGLVTPTSNGSHRDMDYALMSLSIDAIVPRLVEMGIVALKHHDYKEVYKLVKEIGIKAEKDMLVITNGVNTYKGLIFILGLAITSCCYTLINQQSQIDIFNNIKIMTINKFFEEKTNTFGEYAHDKYQFTGARGEAVNGLPSVKTVYEFIKEEPLITNKVLHMALIKSIKIIDDSVLLKRAGSIEKYQYFKDRITSIDDYDLNKIKEVTKECIDNNISCGGAADILVTALFINKFINLFW